MIHRQWQEMRLLRQLPQQTCLAALTVCLCLGETAGVASHQQDKLQSTDTTVSPFLLWCQCHHRSRLAVHRLVLVRPRSVHHRTIQRLTMVIAVVEMVHQRLLRVVRVIPIL